MTLGLADDSVANTEGSTSEANHPDRAPHVANTTCQVVETQGRNIPPPPFAAMRDSLWTLSAVTIVTVMRLLFGIDRRIVQLSPDEFANLGMARWISGRGSWNMYDLNTWRPGFAILVAPAYWLSNDPYTVFRIALVLNAVVAGISVVVLIELTKRLTELGHRSATFAACLVALAPASIAASAAAWAEPLVTLTFLLTVRFMLRFYDDPRLLTGLSAIGWSILSFTAHSRLLPLVVVASLLVMGRFIVAGERRLASASMAWSVTGLGASLLLARVVVGSVWDAPDGSHTVGGVARRLTDPMSVLDAAVGQIWYQLAATLGLAGAGVVILIAACANKSHSVLSRADALILVALTAPLVSLSMVFMSGRIRADHAVYGRYNDAVLWPILVIGIAWASRQARAGFAHIDRRAATMHVGVAIALLTTGVVVHVRQGARFTEPDTLEDMIPGVVWMSFGRQPINVLAITIIALALMAFALATLRNRVAFRPVAMLVAISLIGFGAIRVHQRVGVNVNTYEAASAARGLDGDPLSPNQPIGYRFVETGTIIPLSWQELYSQLYQWYLPEYEFVRDRGPTDDVGPYVFAPFDDPAQVEAGSEMLWRDSSSLIALWKEPDRVDSRTELLSSRP